MKRFIQIPAACLRTLCLSGGNFGLDLPDLSRWFVFFKRSGRSFFLRCNALLLFIVCTISHAVANDLIMQVWNTDIGRWEQAQGQKENGDVYVVRPEMRFIRFVSAMDGALPSGEMAYRIKGYDPFWFKLDSAGIRTCNLPEGEHTLELRNVTMNASVEQSLRLCVKSSFFSGIRAGVILSGAVLLLVFLFLRIRQMAISRDRLKTVRMLENTVQKRTTQLQEVVSHRELLIREIHHRVKNNLQVISALLEMQASRSEDPNVKAAIQEGQNRVLSIAFIHQNLYQHDDLKGVEMGSFMHELTSHVRQVFQQPDCPVEVTSEVPSVYIDIDSAVPLGLMINELLTNSFKYAFKGRTHGAIRLVMRAEGEGEYSLRYEDNGVGLPAHYDFARSNSLGLKLIRQLSRQLAGNMHYTFQDGACFELRFKDLEARNRML